MAAEDRISQSNLSSSRDLARRTAQSTAIKTGAAQVGQALGGKAAGSLGSTLSSTFGALAAIYTAFKAYQAGQGIRKLEGAGGITDDELRNTLDLYGAQAGLDKYAPREVSNAIPKELSALSFGNSLPLYGEIGNKLGLLGSKKNEDQIRRDRMRKALENQGVAQLVNGSHHIQLADGTLFDIGKDGNSTYQNFDPTAQVDDQGAGVRRAYNVDASNPNAQQAVGFMNPYAFILTAGDDKLASDMAGYLSSATMSNAGADLTTVQANARHLYESTYAKVKEDIAAQMGVDPASIDTRELALGSLQAMYDMGKITEEELAAFTNGVNQVYGVAPLTDSTIDMQQDPNNPDVYEPQKAEIAAYGPPGGVEVNPDYDMLGNPRVIETPSEPLVSSSQVVGTEHSPSEVSKEFLRVASTPEPSAPSIQESPPPPEVGPDEFLAPQTTAPQDSEGAFVDQYYQQVADAQAAARAEAEAAAEEARKRQLGMTLLQQSPAYKLIQQAKSPTYASSDTSESGIADLAAIIGGV